MIPIGPIIGLLVALARAGNAHAASSDMRPRMGRHYSGHVVARLAAAGLFLLFTRLLISADSAVGYAVCSVLAMLALAYNFPQFIVSHTLVRWGRPRAAYHVACWMGLDWHYDAVQSGAVLMAVRARSWTLSRPGAAPDPELDAWIRDRLQADRQRGLTWYAATALFGFLQGDSERCRGILMTVTRMPWSCGADSAKRSALRWLAADALSRGDHRHAAYLLAEVRFFFDVSLRALRDVALERAYGVRPTLVGRLARLLSRGKLPASPTVTPPRVDLTSTQGLVGGLAALRTAPTTWAHLEALAGAWQATLEAPDFAADLGKRSAELGGKGNGEDLCHAVAGDVVHDCAYALYLGRFPLVVQDGTLFGASLRMAQSAYIERFGEKLSMLGQRLDHQAALDDLEEAREAGAIFDAYLDLSLLGGEGMRALAFAQAYPLMSRYGVALDHHGNLAYRAIAHSIFTWLHAEAVALELPDTVELEARNRAATG